MVEIHSRLNSVNLPRKHANLIPCSKRLSPPSMALKNLNFLWVLNVDGITGGFNFQNAWSGGYIAGTSIGNLAVAACPGFNW